MNPDLSADALRRAASMLEQIETLKAQFAAILDGTAPRRGRKPGRKAEAAVPEGPAPARRKRRKKRTMSPEARAKIAAAQKARWAKWKREKGGK